MMVTGEKPKGMEASSLDPTWTALGANQGLCGEKPATNHLCYGLACPDGPSGTCSFVGKILNWQEG